ncbi:hypothetical protein ElyMa_000078900 [Elysia marginata]|uniref:Uncharacterized protein n=1 Tax=Elysia marginata TaxID=1093978 RepID=A0AAV4EIK7_9GAST|nr:hypothetical protein ElyMa_000078900 [Elysia marginata]
MSKAPAVLATVVRDVREKRKLQGTIMISNFKVLSEILNSALSRYMKNDTFDLQGHNKQVTVLNACKDSASGQKSEDTTNCGTILTMSFNFQELIDCHHTHSHTLERQITPQARVKIKGQSL